METFVLNGHLATAIEHDQFRQCWPTILWVCSSELPIETQIRASDTVGK